MADRPRPRIALIGPSAPEEIPMHATFIASSS
jgi:hypothetical protein